MYDMSKEDFDDVRNSLAENGVEITPKELFVLFEECMPVFKTVDKPGIRSLAKRLKDGRNY